MRQRAQKPKRVMVWAGVGYNLKTPLVFISEGTKINQVVYRNLLRHEVRAWMKEKALDFTFQQDGAPAHTANETQAWCERNFSDFIRKEHWPPSSPDLTPLDYSIWGILQQKVCAQPHKDIGSLMESLQTAWDALDQEVINKAIEQLPERLKACVEAKGGHFE